MSKKMERRNTTRLVEMIGKHTTETVSQGQQTIALSSAEADPYASGRAVGGRSAGRGTLRRTGCGGLKHVQTRCVWVQEALRERRFLLIRITHKENPGEFGEKHHLADLEGPCLNAERNERV